MWRLIPLGFILALGLAVGRGLIHSNIALTVLGVILALLAFFFVSGLVVQHRRSR